MQFVISFLCEHCGRANAIGQDTESENVGPVDFIRKVIGPALNLAFYAGQVNVFTILRCQFCERDSGVLGFVYRDKAEAESIDFEVSHEDLMKHIEDHAVNVERTDYVERIREMFREPEGPEGNGCNSTPTAT